ncbi:MAG: beta-ketoacyl synthase, partial [Acidobacteria bacterium]|nr:beta-ketoacyl synthase [Acidobacteriota bacterium]
MSRIGIFGWGIVAPRSPDVEAFAANLRGSESWLAPFHGFGRDNFLVGRPEFDFNRYRPWIDARFKPNRFPQLEEKMDLPSKYAIGCFIQALEQNPGMEAELSRLGTQAHVYVGSGLGNIDTLYDNSLTLYRAQRRWNRFWAAPERNEALAAYLRDPGDGRHGGEVVPPEPESVPTGHRQSAQDAWWDFWAARSEPLALYLQELAEIESLSVEGEVEAGKLRLLKEKSRRKRLLQKKWDPPEPPWTEVSANVIWNIQNTPAAQISMLGHITGLAFAPVAACSTFGVALKLAMDAIRRGEAKAVVVGATDPSPHPLIVGAFYGGRVISADGRVSKPLGGMRGTHVSGGAVVWIVGDWEHMTARGFEPLGLEPLAVGVSSDADHIITPSREGPISAIDQALAAAEVEPADLVSWDLHATA